MRAINWEAPFTLKPARQRVLLRLVVTCLITPLEMRRTLSSAQTFAFKYAFPVLWIGGFGLGTVALWLGGFHVQDGGPPPSWMRWQFLIAWVVGSAVIVWFSRRVKRVQVDEQSLYISNYFSEVSVPLTEVTEFSESRWTRPPTVTIHFR